MYSSTLTRSVAAIALAALCGCSNASGPFSLRTAGVRALIEEEPLLYRSGASAAAALAGSTHASLASRVSNLITTYEQELVRAESSEGGALNAAFSITALAVPLAGTIGSAVLASGQAQTLSTVTSAVNTATAGAAALVRPGERAALAKACSRFLRNALESLRQRWDPATIESLSGSTQEWELYLAVRASLDAGRNSVCPGTPATAESSSDDEIVREVSREAEAASETLRHEADDAADTLR